MKLEIHDDPAPLRMDPGDQVRIGTSRVTLNVFITEFESGACAEEIVASFPTVSLADAYATIAYYLRHRAEVDEYLKELRQEEVRLYAEAKVEQDRLGIRERLEARRRKVAEPE